MRLKTILTACLAGLALTAAAQTHKEGVEYYKADQMENARTLLERNLNNPGTDKAVAYYYLGQIQLEDGNPSKAAEYFEKGLQANPDYAYNYVGLGQIQLANNAPKEAARNFKEAENHGKKDPSLQVAIARAYYNVNPVEYEKEISKKIEKARKMNIEEPDVYIFEGDVLADQKDWGGAGAKYEMAVNYDANEPAAYVKYANLFRQVNIDYAINMLQKLLQNNPGSALGQRQLANVYYDKGDFAQAAQQYGNYVKNPNHFKEDEDRYSFLLFYDGKYQEGYDYATQLLAGNPDNFTAMRYQFMNAAQLKDLGDQLLPMAERLYAAQKANPSKNKFAPIDYTLIADEFARDKKYPEAVTVLQEGMLAIPGNANFNKQLAGIYVDANDLPKASDAFAGYIEKTKEPDYNDFVQQALYSYFAGVQDLTADPAAAAKYFALASDNCQKASSIAPNQYKPKKILADIAIANAPKEKVASAGQPLYEEAIVLLENSQDPSRYKSDAKAMYNYLGNYYLDQKNIAKAKEYFNKYLTLDPDNADYRKFVESL